MKKIVISADIVSSTSLQTIDKELLEKSLQSLLSDLNKSMSIFGRIIKGDSLEIVVPKPQDGLKAAIAIKSFVKTLPINIESYEEGKFRAQHFKTHGVRLAMGYGELERFIPEEGIIDGEAIYLSGRAISNMHTYDKERITIKNTLFFESKNEELNNTMLPIVELLDVLLSKATEKQCMVLYLKLLGNTEAEISKIMKIDQSVVNRHSTNVGWNAIDTTVSYFSNLMKNLK